MSATPTTAQVDAYLAEAGARGISVDRDEAVAILSIVLAPSSTPVASWEWHPAQGEACAGCGYLRDVKAGLDYPLTTRAAYPSTLAYLQANPDDATLRGIPSDDADAHEWPTGPAEAVA